MTLAGEDTLLVNARNLLTAVEEVFGNIQIASIKIEDDSVRERLGLKWVPVKRDAMSEQWKGLTKNSMQIFFFPMQSLDPHQHSVCNGY